jgi:hypothetical protein
MVIFCNRDNTHGCVKILYPSRKVVFNASDVFVDIGLGKAMGDGVDLIDYLNYVLFVARSNPNAKVLAIVPDAWGDAPRNVWLATEFYAKMRRRQVPSNLTMFIVVHGGLLDTYWMQYKVLFYNYNRLVTTGFAIPSRKMDLGREAIDCNRKPLQCSASVRAFMSKARQELGNNVPIHLLGANKRTLTSLGESLRHVYSFDSDAYRLVPNNKLRKEDLGDRRFMVTTAVDARKWANEWLGELVRYIEVGV